MRLNESVLIHEQLNPKLWDEENKLHSDVKEKLMEIVQEFIAYCELDFKVLDARIVGSNASYNYTSSSDIDLHIVTSYSDLDCNPDLAGKLFDLEKSSFNSKFDITIKGLNLEIYVEDVKAGTRSNGIYSIMHDKWIKFPSKDDIESIDISDYLQKAESQIEAVLGSTESSDIQDLIDQLYLMRKNGLDSQGEYSVGNQVFKELRSLGYLDRIKDRYNELKSTELTLEGLK